MVDDTGSRGTTFIMQTTRPALPRSSGRLFIAFLASIPLAVAVARELGVSPAHVFSVATFYKAFSLEPRGRHLCTVCMGTACHVRGGGAILEHFERKLGIRAGETSPDREYTLERVNCLGACALAPLAVVDGRYIETIDNRDDI